MDEGADTAPMKAVGVHAIAPETMAGTTAGEPGPGLLTQRCVATHQCYRAGPRYVTTASPLSRSARDPQSERAASAGWVRWWA